eukprot:TRINITY_DN8888_c0_g1_i2.p1 TRINITY_DN8888_c0_g1~~TRINITY_DN8888_c0_g1_i2.p1  ORF type:complete len:192 (-),score=35.28 TRINITY_DN8888_c0_g1_i2:69-644(-)
MPARAPATASWIDHMYGAGDAGTPTASRAAGVSAMSGTDVAASQSVPEGDVVAAEFIEGNLSEMAEASAQWSRHAAYTASKASQAAQYAAQQAQTATTSAQNAVAQMQFLVNHPDLRAGAAAALQAVPPVALIAVLLTEDMGSSMRVTAPLGKTPRLPRRQSAWSHADRCEIPQWRPLQSKLLPLEVARFL